MRQITDANVKRLTLTCGLNSARWVGGGEQHVLRTKGSGLLPLIGNQIGIALGGTPIFDGTVLLTGY